MSASVPEKPAIVTRYCEEEIIPPSKEETAIVPGAVYPHGRKFGINDLWNIRIKQKYFSIHRNGLY